MMTVKSTLNADNLDAGNDEIFKKIFINVFYLRNIIIDNDTPKFSQAEESKIFGKRK